MKLTEGKLRRVIREEISRLDETQLRRLRDKYSRVANDAFDQVRDRPNVAKDHIQAMIEICQNLTLNMEQNDQVLDSRVQQLQEALIDAEVSAKLLFKEQR